MGLYRYINVIHMGRENFGNGEQEFMNQMEDFSVSDKRGNGNEYLSTNTHLNYIDREKEKSSEKVFKFTEKLGNLKMALGLKSEKVAEQLSVILEKSQTLPESDAVTLLEDTVNNPYLDIDVLARYDSEDLDAVAKLLEGFPDLDSKGRGSIMREIADV